MNKKSDDNEPEPQSVNQTMSDSPHGLQVGRDFIFNQGDTAETKEKLREIHEAIKALGAQASNESLLKQFPLGYVIFDIDFKNQVTPYDQHLVSQYDIDWSVVELKTNAQKYALRLPDFRPKSGDGGLTDIWISAAKEPSIYASGACVNDLMVLGRILAVTEKGVVFVVGFARMPKLPS